MEGKESTDQPHKLSEEIPGPQGELAEVSTLRPGPKVLRGRGRRH